ncbi:MAG: squalene synthase HpnC [Acidobacteria bacterium]|nr:squalene synthase HpnC [Acidobacteriota bacterium]
MPSVKASGKLESKQWSKATAFNHCEKIALGHYENFPVGSVLIPRAQRPHFYSIYAFARGADDFADEGDLSREERIKLLNEWRDMLVECQKNSINHPVFIALAETIKIHKLPVQLFHDLIDAFTLDVKRSRHASFADLLDYSRCSANPVGRLILLLFGYKDEYLHQMSDKICTALQLTNFWQDILVDLAKDRIYIPQEEQKKFGYSEIDLRASLYCDSYIRMMTSLADRTEYMFLEGKPLCNVVRGRLAIELKAVWLGGTSLLNALREQKFNIFDNRPTIKTPEKIKILLKTFLSF